MATEPILASPAMAEQMQYAAAQHERSMIIQSKQARLHFIQLAKETLLENARSKPVDEREVTAANITAFAAELEALYNNE